MKILAAVALVIANLLVLSAAVLAALSPQVHELGRIASAVAAACTLGVVGLLVTACMVRLPPAARVAMPVLSAGMALAWTVGSIGPGGADAKVAGFLVLVALVALAGWLVFRRLQAAPAA
jgi:hypothetical protein